MDVDVQLELVLPDGEIFDQNNNLNSLLDIMLRPPHF